jgi:hypothetical protein
MCPRHIAGKSAYERPTEGGSVSRAEAPGLGSSRTLQASQRSGWLQALAARLPIRSPVSASEIDAYFTTSAGAAAERWRSPPCTPRILTTADFTASVELNISKESNSSSTTGVRARSV